MHPLFLLDFFGIVVFAVSGTLKASRNRMDVLGCVFVGTMTGIGGGTVRDVLLGATPVFWIDKPVYVLLCLAGAGLALGASWLGLRRAPYINWADAVGLAVFAVLGTQAALQAGAPVLPAVVLGAITATFGGIVRDVLCAEVPLVLRGEIYATAALVGGAAFVLVQSLGLGGDVAALLGALAAFLVRAAAIAFGLSLPRMRPATATRPSDMR